MLRAHYTFLIPSRILRTQKIVYQGRKKNGKHDIETMTYKHENIILVALFQKRVIICRVKNTKWLKRSEPRLRWLLWNRTLKIEWSHCKQNLNWLICAKRMYFSYIYLTFYHVWIFTGFFGCILVLIFLRMRMIRKWTVRSVAPKSSWTIKRELKNSVGF